MEQVLKKMKRIIILLTILTLITLTSCSEPSSYKVCKNDCIELQCKSFNKSCLWADYDWYIGQDGELNQEEVDYIDNYCFNECKGTQ